MPPKRLPPVHPGEVLLEEFLLPLGLTQYRLAKDLSVPARRINEVVHGTRAISADTALRLGRYFGTSDRYWLNLQAAYDLDVARDRLGDRLLREVAVRRPPTAGAATGSASRSAGPAAPGSARTGKADRCTPGRSRGRSRRALP